MRNPVRTGTMIALAAASLFTAACSKKDESSSNKPTTTETKPAPASPAAGDEKTAKIHCEGINSCKGQGSCKSAQNACKGQNGCKGKSFAYTASEDECKTKGGTVVAEKM